MATPRFIYQDNHIFAVEKPAGMHSVGTGSARTGLDLSNSVAGWLIKAMPELSRICDKPGDAGLINRLDHDTSGILLGARVRSAYESFRKMILAGEIHKEYLALVEGELSGEHKVSSWLGSRSRSAAKVKVYTKKPAKSVRALPAQTIFKAVESLSKGPDKTGTLVNVICHAARRHQIRAHAAFIGHALAGDELYGAKLRLLEILPNELERGFLLHAAQASFKHPISGKMIEIISQLDLKR